MTAVNGSNGEYELSEGTWRLWTRRDAPDRVTIAWPRGGRAASFVIASACDTLEGRDAPERLSPPAVRQRDDAVEIIWKAQGAFWPRKEYHLICRSDSLEFFYLAGGKAARVTDCWFFRGAAPTDRNDFPWPLIFTPNSDWLDKRYGTPAEHIVISVNRHLGGAALTPAPWCFGCSGDGGGWASVGIAEKPGRYNFMGFECLEGSFRLTYEGHLRVAADAVFETPHLVLQFGAASEYDALAAYASWLKRHGYLDHVQAPVATPAWWRQPLFCGWGEQVARVYLRDGVAREVQAPYLNTQALYEETLTLLESKGISPGIVVVDEGWQDDDTYHAEGLAHPQRWPDLRGFIDRQHRKGRRIFLWFGAWCRQGVPASECATRGGFPMTVDPSNPAYERRLRRVVRKMISSDGYDADGLKLDHINYVPSESTPRSPVRWFRDASVPESAEPIRVAGDIWGGQMLYRLLEIMRVEMKSAKPDAVMATFAANPCFAGLTDLFQLGDMGNPALSISRMMEHRGRMARIIAPHWVMYPADWAPKSRPQWREYVRVMPQLGIPCLHFVTYSPVQAPTKNDLTDWIWEPLEDCDYRLVAETWAEYRRMHGLPTPR